MRAFKELLRFGCGRTVYNLLRRWIHELAKIDEVEIIAELFRKSKSDNVMLDIGAHWGESLDTFAGMGWKVHAFEPDPQNFSKLSNRYSNSGNVSCWQTAVTEVGQGAISFFCNHDNSFISGLRRIDDGEYREVKVDTVSIEVFCAGKDLREVTFLKIDAEGYDLDVLRGVPWDTCRPEIILCEFDEKKALVGLPAFSQITEYLAGKGYSLLISEWYPISTVRL